MTRFTIAYPVLKAILSQNIRLRVILASKQWTKKLYAKKSDTMSITNLTRDNKQPNIIYKLVKDL